MNFMTDELLLNLGRTTLTLAVAVLLIGLLLRVARVSAPSVHRAGCLLALAVGWTFLQWPVHVPWYDAAGIVDDDPSDEAAAGNDWKSTSLTNDPTTNVIDLPVHDVSADTVASSSVPLPTIELPHEDLSRPLEESPAEETTATVPTVDETPATPIADLAVDAPMAGPSEDSSIEIVSDDVSQAILLPDEELAIVEGAVEEPRNVLAAAAQYLGAAWISGVATLVLFWLLGYIRFVRRLPPAREGDADWFVQWQSLLAEQGVRAAVPLRITHDTGPMLCRLPRGYELLVPGPLWRELSMAERAAILRHELAHLVRGDVWKSLAARLLALPHWFNPFAWWAVRRFDEAAEWSCDRAAAAENSTTAYARALLRLGEAAGRHAAYSPAARGRPLASRIRRLLAARTHEDSPTKKALLLAACIGFAVAALVRVELVAQEAPGPGPEASEMVVASENDALALADSNSPQSSESGSKSAKSSLDLLADQSRGKIQLTADEIAARGLRLAIVRPAEAEQVRFKGKTIVDKKAASHVRAFLPGIVVAISLIENAADEKPRPIGFDTKVKQGQVLATVWSKELADKAGELIDACSRLKIETQALDRLRLAEKGAVAQAATWEAERQVATARMGLEGVERTLRSWRIDDEVIERWREAAQTPTPKSEKQPPPEHAPGNYSIVSPIDGLIIEKNVNVGDMVDGSRDLFLVADTATMPVMVEVPEEELPKLNLLPPDARRWQVRSWSDKPDQQMTGTFDLIGAIHQPALHNFLVRGTLENPERRIPFRQTITATISLPTNLDLVTIPAESVLMDPGHGWGRIFVEAKDTPARFELRKVEIVGRAAAEGMLLIRSAPRDEPGVVGTDGLAAGEKVLASGDELRQENVGSHLGDEHRDKLPLTVAVDGPTKLRAGDEATFVVKMTNTGSEVVRNLVVKVNCGLGIEAVSVTEGHDFDDAWLRWRLDSLEAHKAVVWQLRCRGAGRIGRTSIDVQVSADGLQPVEKVASVTIESRSEMEIKQSPEESLIREESVLDVKEAAPPTQPASDTAPADGGERARPRYPDVIEAARTGYETARVEYDQDRITLDQLCDWSNRLLQAESSSELVVDNPDEADVPGGDGEPAIRFPNDQERLAFEQAHLARMKEVQQRILALYKIGARGGEAEKKAMMDYYVAEAERSLARLQRHIAMKKRSAEALAAVKKDTGGGLRAVDEQGRQHEDSAPDVTDNEVKQVIKFSRDAGGRNPSAAKRKPWRPADDARTRLRYDGRTFEDWVTQLDTDLSLQARTEAIGALAAFGQRGFGPEATKKLMDLLNDEETQPLAIRALGKIGPAAEEAIPAIEEAAANEELSRDATQAIARIRGEKVEKVSARALLAKRETKLRELLQQKNEQLVRDMKDVEGLQKNLGIVDPATAAAQSQMLQQQLAVVSNSIFSHTAQVANLEVEIDKLKLDIELARDPAAREARAEEEMLKDDRLRSWGDQLVEVETALIDEKEDASPNDRDVRVLSKRKQQIEERIAARREELMKKFSDVNEAVKVKEYEGKKLATEKHRDSVVEQLKDLRQQQSELTEKLSVMTRDTAELDVKRARIRVQQQIVDKLEHELQALSIEKLNLDEATAVPVASPKQSTATPPKKSAEAVPAAPAPTTVTSSQPPARALSSTRKEEPSVVPTVERARATATIRDGKGVAFLRVVHDDGRSDNNGYQTYRTTIKELIRSKSLLERVVRNPTIAQLPLVQLQTDPVQWLCDHLQVSYPNDGELLEIALPAIPEQAKQIVDAVVDTYLSEVVEKGIGERAKKAEKLAALHKKKMAEVDAERKRLQTLEKLTQELNTDLEKLEAEQKSPRRVERVVPPPKDDSSQRAPDAAPAEVAPKPADSPVSAWRFKQAVAGVQVKECELKLAAVYDRIAKHQTAIDKLAGDESYKDLSRQLAELNDRIAEARAKATTPASEAIAKMDARRSELKQQVEARRLEILRSCATRNEGTEIRSQTAKLDEAKARLADLTNRGQERGMAPGATSLASPANNLNTFLADQELSLRNELQTKSETLLHAAHDFKNLRRTLGVADPIEAAERSAAIHRRLAAVDQELRQRTAECLTLDAAITKMDEEIAWRKDEASRKARIAEVLQNDVPLLQFEKELVKRTKALQAAAQPDEAEKLAIGALSQKRDARREQLIADATALNAWKLREAVGSLAITHRKRDRLQEQMALLRREDVELTKQAEEAARATLATRELEAKKQQIKELQTPVDELNKKLYEISKLKLAAREKENKDPAAKLARRDKLEQLLAAKREELERNEKSAGNLRKMIGATDAADAPRVRQEMDQQLLQLDKELFDHRAQCASLENELDQLRLDVELARDPHIKQGRIAEAIKNDAKLKKLNDQFQELTVALAAAKRQINGDDNPALKRLDKARTAVEDKITLRRQEITDRLSGEEGQLVLVREKQDKLVAVQKQRDDVKQGLDKLKQRRATLIEKQNVVARDAAELEAIELRTKTLGRLVEELEADLEKWAATPPDTAK